jgi:hypothetical protein
LDDDVCDCSERAGPAVLTPGEAARRLGVTRSRIYALVRQGELDDAGGEALRVTLASVERRLGASPPVGEPISPLGAWAILALASHDAAFRMHVAGWLSDRERSRRGPPRTARPARPRAAAGGAGSLLGHGPDRLRTQQHHSLLR